MEVCTDCGPPQCISAIPTSFYCEFLTHLKFRQPTQTLTRNVSCPLSAEVSVFPSPVWRLAIKKKPQSNDSRRHWPGRPTRSQLQISICQIQMTRNHPLKISLSLSHRFQKIFRKHDHLSLCLMRSDNPLRLKGPQYAKNS